MIFLSFKLNSSVSSMAQTFSNNFKYILTKNVAARFNQSFRNSEFQCKPAEPAKVPPPPKRCSDMHKPLGDKRYFPVTHVMFNLDGVVINSERLIMEAHTKYLAKFRKQYSLDLRMKVQGRKENDAAAIVVNELMLPITAEVYAHGVRQYLRDLMPKVRIMKGVRDLVCHLSLNKIPISLNTSSTERTFEWKTKDRDLKDILHRFCHITLGSEVKIGKPDPSHYLISLNKFTEKPKDVRSVLAIEDSEAGVLSAKAAGFQTVMIPDVHTPDSIKKEADLVISNIGKLDLDEFSLPALASGAFY